MILEEIIHSVGYTQDGTKANFSFNEANMIAQRYAQSQTQELTYWKESASKVFKNLDLQTLGKTLGIGLGDDVSTNVLPKVKELIEQNRELVELLQENIKQGRMTLIADKKAMELLTKYNHLKSNTNETDKI